MAKISSFDLKKVIFSIDTNKLLTLWFIFLVSLEALTIVGPAVLLLLFASTKQNID